MRLFSTILTLASASELAYGFLAPGTPLLVSSPSCTRARNSCGAISMKAAPQRQELGDISTMQQPMGRNQMIRSAVLAVGTAAVTIARPSTSIAAAGVDFSKVRADVEGIIDKDADRGPTLVRLAWHSSGTYDKISKTGGSQGGTMRFEQEMADGANAGISAAVKWLEPIKKKYPEISYGDLYTLAGVTAIEKMGGPQITWRAGRKDNDVTAVPAGGRLPAADKGNPMATAQGLRDVFYRMGFNDREIVALSGAHALGRCHVTSSGYDGPWTPTPNYFAGATYFKLLKTIPWKERENFTPMQYQDPSGQLMMLPSDIVLLEDKNFKKYVDVYAADDKVFFEDFAKAFSTLLELGTKDLHEVSA